jgi:hypothetical protein
MMMMIMIDNVLRRVWGRRGVYTGFWWVNVRERDRLGDPDVDGRINYDGFWVTWPPPRASIPLQIAGSNPAEAVWFFGGKHPQRAFLRRGSKAVLSHVADLRHVKIPAIYVEVGIAGHITFIFGNSRFRFSALRPAVLIDVFRVLLQSVQAYFGLEPVIRPQTFHFTPDTARPWSRRHDVSKKLR